MSENAPQHNDTAEAQAQTATATTAQTQPAAAAQPTDSNSKIAELEAQVKEKENKYLYLYAEFENYKKRAVKERSDLIKFGWEPVARDLLHTADNMDLALQHAPATTDKNLLEGLKMVLNHFRETLNRQGVNLIDALQKPFDPNLHEAMGEESSEHPAGTILKEHTKGYTLHGRLLRPARVTVAAEKKNQA